MWREHMLAQLRQVAVRPISILPIFLQFTDKFVLRHAIALYFRTHTVDEALQLNTEEKGELSSRQPSAKRANPAQEQPATSAAEGVGTPSAWASLCLRLRLL